MNPWDGLKQASRRVLALENRALGPNRDRVARKTRVLQISMRERQKARQGQ